MYNPGQAGIGKALLIRPALETTPSRMPVAVPGIAGRWKCSPVPVFLKQWEIFLTGHAANRIKLLFDVFVCDL